MKQGILEKINCPQDLQKLTSQEMDQLAREIRQVLIETVAKNGGHLAPNLGVVELTIALHRVFDSPRDRLVWDVGHQTYIHKLLTGRLAQFPSLRQYGGLSGFPKRAESAHDPFDTGHSSTSISAAVGLAKARDLQGARHKVVAIIGDGALTGGLAFEALNHAGHLGTDLIVVLNDNEMSIAPNVGAMAGYLSRLRTDPKYYKGKEDLEQLLRKIPAIGPTVVKAAERIKDSFKYLVVPGMLFEEMGFTYLGPIDGHNLGLLEEVLTRAKTIRGPVLVHAITKKGKGYGPAEKDPDKFHGIGPFDISTGQPLGGSPVPSYTQVYGETIVRLAQEDDRILAITAAMPSGTGLRQFAARFPERFLDVGIAEQHAVTMAAGLAVEGFKPVATIYSTFLQRAYDQIVHDVCLQNLPVTFAIDRAGLVGDDGATHQGVFDYAYLRHIPNMVVMAPKDENELRHMLKTAINYPGPAALRYPRGAGVGVPFDEAIEELAIGKGEVLKEGKDLVILAVGSMVHPALEAGQKLSALGIDAAVINARFVKPLDAELIIHYAQKTGKVVTVEEHVLEGGFGSAVLELLESRNLQVRVKRMGIPDEFVEHGPSKKFLEKYGLTTEGITSMVLEEMAVRPKAKVIHR